MDDSTFALMKDESTLEIMYEWFGHEYYVSQRMSDGSLPSLWHPDNDILKEKLSSKSEQISRTSTDVSIVAAAYALVIGFHRSHGLNLSILIYPGMKTKLDSTISGERKWTRLSVNPPGVVHKSS